MCFIGGSISVLITLLLSRAWLPEGHWLYVTPIWLCMRRVTCLASLREACKCCAVFILGYPLAEHSALMSSSQGVGGLAGPHLL